MPQRLGTAGLHHSRHCFSLLTTHKVSLFMCISASLSLPILFTFASVTTNTVNYLCHNQCPLLSFSDGKNYKVHLFDCEQWVIDGALNSHWIPFTAYHYNTITTGNITPGGTDTKVLLISCFVINIIWTISVLDNQELFTFICTVSQIVSPSFFL